jgi:hypothetical protein
MLEILPSIPHIMGVCLGWECGWRYMMEQGGGAQVQNYNSSSTSPYTLNRSTHIMLYKTKEIPKVVDI